MSTHVVRFVVGNRLFDIEVEADEDGDYEITGVTMFTEVQLNKDSNSFESDIYAMVEHEAHESVAFYRDVETAIAVDSE